MPFISAVLLQGGADAFVQAQLALPVASVPDQAMRIEQIGFEITTAGWAFAAANANMEVCFTRRTKTAMPLSSDIDVLRKFKRLGSAAGAAFAVIQDGFLTWQPRTEEDVLLVEPYTYVQLDSNLTGMTLAGIARIDYTIVKIKELDRLTLLTQSLSTS